VLKAALDQKPSNDQADITYEPLPQHILNQGASSLILVVSAEDPLSEQPN
jgi:hypothetical protein